MVTKECGNCLKASYEYLFSGLQCEAPASLRGFFDQITNLSAPKIMLIGSDCSVSTEPVAEISHHWNLVQVCSYITCITRMQI